MSLAPSRTYSRLGLTYRTRLGGQWASEVAPAAFQDVWEDNIWPNVSTITTHWVECETEFVPVNQFTAQLTANYYGPGPVYPSLNSSKCEWTSGLMSVDYASYVGSQFGGGLVMFILQNGSQGTSGMYMQTGFGFSCVPEPVWKDGSSTGAAPAPERGWYLSRGLWSITLIIAPPIDATLLTASLAVTPHRRDCGLAQRRALGMGGNQRVFYNVDLLGVNTKTSIVDLRSSALWCPYVECAMRRPDGFTFSAGAQAFDIYVEGTRLYP